MRLKSKKWVDDGFCFEIPIPQDYSKDINLREADLKEIENIKIKNITSNSEEKEFEITFFFQYGLDFPWIEMSLKKENNPNEYSIVNRTEENLPLNLLLNSKNIYTIDFTNIDFKSSIKICIKDKDKNILLNHIFIKYIYEKEAKISLKLNNNQLSIMDSLYTQTIINF